VFLLALLLPVAAGADVKALWPIRTPHPFHEALKVDLGFSFSYDGKRIGPEQPVGWESAFRDEGRQLELRHPSGLTVTRIARVWPVSEAIEYTLKFRNESRTPLSPLSAVNVMDLSFSGDIVNGVSVLSSGGGTADAYYPPRNFALTRTYLGPMTPLSASLMLTTEWGYSSRTNLPFFFLENASNTAGLFVAIGWTGQWKANIQANYLSHTLRLQGGMSELNLKLAPGEEITSPVILAGCFRGTLADGSNRLRRLIRENYAPPVGSEQLEAPILYTTWFDIGAELDEQLFKTLVDRAAGLGIEIIMLDAGWYKGTLTHKYTDMAGTWLSISNPLGNWELGEERSRFPSGLRALADYVRSRGLKFGLWFEPERSGPESLLAEKHPDWLIAPVPPRRWRVVDFGRLEVQEYFSQILDRYIRELDIRYIRWDQNLEQLPYWQSHDSEGRRGITEIRHLEGIHRVEDFIRRNHPQVILESCAGGGNRIDLATIQRRHTYWISDQTMDPLIVKFHLEGLNHFLPGNGQMVAFSPPKETYQQPGFEFPDIAFQSYFGGAFGIAGRLHEWPQSLESLARKHIAAFKGIRRFLAEDFYLLELQARDLETWSGWQFHDPKTGEGFVQAFRIRSSEGARRLVMKALDSKNLYRFTDIYTGETFTAQGASLISDGLEWKLPPMASRVLTYRTER
jgi:alpha-galactosidase